MLSVVIPAHNEADHIRGLLEAFSVFSGLELIVAVDASTDGTQNIVQEFAAHNNNVLLSSCDTLTGKGAAVKRGLKLAKGDVLGFIDGDGSIHPEELMRVAATINDGADLAVGSRDLPPLCHCPSATAVATSLRFDLQPARACAVRYPHKGFSVWMQGVSPRRLELTYDYL